MSATPTLLALRRIRPQIMRIAAKYGITLLQVYGDVAEGVARPGATVQLLAHLEPGRGAFDLVGFAQEVQEVSGFPVSAVTELPGQLDSTDGVGPIDL